MLEISSPSGIWKELDVTAQPLNETALSEKIINDARVREYYFDGYAVEFGKVRSFIRITEHPNAKGVILYLPANSERQDNIPQEFYDYGYTVAVLDYLGRTEDGKLSDGIPRFTIYPKELSFFNSRGQHVFDAPSDATKCRWTAWTFMARRAILLLNKLYPEEKKFALGKGMGGTTVYKLAAFDDGLTACATLLDILPIVRGTGNQLISYRAALDNTAYASLCKIPLFMAVASNDEDKLFDEMTELASNTASLKSFRIVERAFSGGIRVAHKQCDNFFTEIATEKPLLPVPQIAPSNSNNKLYFNINLPDAENCKPVSEIKLFCAFRIENPMHRNWTNVSLVSMGANNYMANVFVLDSTKPIFVFVNVEGEDGDVMSSNLITLVPKSLGLKAQAPNSTYRRLIYDGSMGKDLWSPARGGTLSIKSGPFGIDGVTSDCNSLATFKPGDLLYKGASDALLQFIVYGKPQTLTISLLEEDNTYSCQIELTDNGEWSKITLSPQNLMCNNRHLVDWENIMVFMIEGTDEFLISSVIWV